MRFRYRVWTCALMELVYGVSERAALGGHTQMEIYMGKQGWVAVLVALLRRTPCVADAQPQLSVLAL